MKLSVRWLEEFVHAGLEPRALAERLTLAGLEVESIAPVAPPFQGVYVGEVLESSGHSDAQKLQVCQVTTDGTNRLQIVCGASNVRAGLKVAVATIGASLPNEIRIGRARLRGVDSEGMLCSARELGLGTEQEGILELDADAPLGVELRQALDLDDAVLEVNVTPNRGDCMSVLGIARDYVAAQAQRLPDFRPEPVAPVGRAQVSIRLDAPEACPVFAGRVIRGLSAQARTPLWLRERLRRAGIASISAIVDVTNYLMIESGQPMHAYDLAKLREPLLVRWAKRGETIALLDGKTLVLEPDCLLIADARGPLGLAGIMGGGEQAIGANTVDVLLEAAHFSPEAIIGRARRFGLLTDASQRFERGVDPTLPERAIERATALLLQIAGGEPGPAQVVRARLARRETWVPLRRARLASLVGAEIPDAEVVPYLGAIGDAVESSAEGWRVRVPPHRFDLAIEADLIEEVARLRGFGRIDARAARMTQKPGASSESRVASDRLLTMMTDRGFHEAITYSFVDAKDQRALYPDAAALALSNPIAADLGEMRLGLWPGLLRACAQNLHRQQSRVRLFELGRKYLPTATSTAEIESLAGVACGARDPEQWGIARDGVDFYDLKADVTALFELTGDAGAFEFASASHTALRPGRSARVLRSGIPIGWIGELHPTLAKRFDISPAACVFELDIEEAFNSNKLKFIELSRYPSIRRDLAIVVDEAVSFARIRENVTVASSNLLRELRVFDIYRGQGIEFGRKSIALGLILQDSSRTLTDDDADAVVAAIVAQLRRGLSATIRDQ